MRATVAVLGTYAMLVLVAFFAMRLASPAFVPQSLWLRAFDVPGAAACAGVAACVPLTRRGAGLADLLLGFGVAVAGFAWLESSRALASAGVWVLTLGAIVLMTGVQGIARRRGAEFSFGSTWALGALFVFVGLWILPGRLRVNRLGLVSSGASWTAVAEPRNDDLKDGYPLCEFRFNALGYRDREASLEEAPGQRRILVVGDSFIWGDGIPSNDETLGALLRARLQQGAPGQYAVMSAAFPGMGTYGYRRTVESLIPAFNPDVVVVGYLGRSDDDPLDAQVLVDMAMRLGPAARWASNLGVLQDLHELSAPTARDRANPVPAVGAMRSQLFAALSAFGQEPGHRAILLSYAGPDPDAPPDISLPLPAEWRYPGSSSDLWYAKDYHPRPALNRLIAEWLALEILKPGKGRTSETKQNGKGDATIPAGQDDLIRAMLGGPDPIAGCSLRSASVQKTFVEARYACEGEEATLRLLHRDATGPVLATKQFAVALGEGASAALAESVAQRVKAHESEFRWNLIPPREPVEVAKGEAPRVFPWRFTLAAIAAVAFLGSVWRKRRDAANDGEEDR